MKSRVLHTLMPRKARHAVSCDTYAPTALLKCFSSILIRYQYDSACLAVCCAKKSTVFNGIPLYSMRNNVESCQKKRVQKTHRFSAPSDWAVLTCFFYAPLPHEGHLQVQSITSPVSLFVFLFSLLSTAFIFTCFCVSFCPAYLLNRQSIVATTARVEESAGANTSLPSFSMPFTMPEPHAHCIAGIAHSETSKASS